MGKHGPCYHCGVTSTPLWRNGPPEKPVLCNACGSRWRTKGTLANYTPLHKREAPELEMPKRPKESTHLKLKLKNFQKAKWSSEVPETESGMGDYGHRFTKGVDEDTSNRSSSGSAVSFSESCANFSSADVSEVTGSLQTNVWETVVPSRKRTGIARLRHSSVEKLTRDLHSILNEQSSYLTASSEEDLLYESNTSTGLIEIGNGSVLIRHPNSASVEEESEASSLPLRNKSTCAELLLMTDCQSKASTGSDMCNMKIRSSSPQEQLRRDKASQEKVHILRNKESPLGSIDLDDIVCFDGYMKYLTNEEQQHLMRYLPSVDTANPPESLKSMFSCPQIAQSFSSFQHLLQEGIFDLSTSKINSGDCKNLQEGILTNLTKAAWVESYKTLKDARSSPKDNKQEDQDGTTFLGHSTPSLKRPYESYNDNFEEPKVVMKCLKKGSKTMRPSLPSLKSIKQNPGELPKKPKIDSRSNIESNCSSNSLGSPPALSSQKGIFFSSTHLTDGNPDEDLLVDVRSTTYFPEAELLSDAWLQNTPSKRSCGESGASGKEGSLLCHSTVSFTSNLPKQW